MRKTLLICDITDWLKNTMTYFSTSKEKLFLLVKGNKLKRQNKFMWPVLGYITVKLQTYTHYLNALELVWAKLEVINGCAI
jgi:Ni,Fe-hydrogenase I large subunit